MTTHFKHWNGQTDKQTDRQTDRQTDGQKLTCRSSANFVCAGQKYNFRKQTESEYDQIV